MHLLSDYRPALTVRLKTKTSIKDIRLGKCAVWNGVLWDMELGGCVVWSGGLWDMELGGCVVWNGGLWDMKLEGCDVWNRKGGEGIY